MADPVGATEVAVRCGVDLGTVKKWQQRHRAGYPDFPQPRRLVGNRPAWDWALDIVPWLTATGRPVPDVTSNPWSQEITMQTTAYIASIGTARDCVSGDFCDVKVSEADTTAALDDDGNEITQQIMSDRTVLDAETFIRTDDPDKLTKVEATADAILAANGWSRTAPWTIEDNALYAIVERIGDNASTPAPSNTIRPVYNPPDFKPAATPEEIAEVAEESGCDPEPDPALAGWDISGGCRINYGREPDGSLVVDIQLGPDYDGSGVIRRSVTPGQLVQHAQHLLRVAGDELDAD